MIEPEHTELTPRDTGFLCWWIVWAMQNNRDKVAKYLLSKKQYAELSNSDKSFIEKQIAELAKRESRSDVLNFLANNKPFDINLTDTRGETILFYATRLGLREDQIEYLVSEIGVKRNIKNENGHTAADVAFHKGHISIQKKLKHS